MKKIELGQAITVLANVGVIVGIAFLAIELQQNTNVLESQMRFTQNERETEVIEELFRNPDLISAYIKYENGEELSRYEDLVLSSYAQRVFYSVQWIWGEVEQGNMPVDLAATFRKAFHYGPAGDRQTDFYLHYWENAGKSSMNPEFVRFVNERIVP
jgi:hypothetical protein